MRSKKILTTTTFAKRVCLLKRVTDDFTENNHTGLRAFIELPHLSWITLRYLRFIISLSVRHSANSVFLTRPERIPCRCRLKTNATKTLMRYRAGLSASQVNEDRFKPEDKRGRCVATNFNKYLRAPLFRERRYRGSIGKHGANRADKLDRSAIPEYNIFIGRYRSQIAKFSARPIWITYSNLLARLTREYERSLID